MSAIKDNEAAYDEKIAPLMKQIIAICKEHGIPMFATFVYGPDGFCTTSLPVDHFYKGAKDSAEHRALLAAYNAVCGNRGRFAAFTITTAPRPKATP